MQIKSKNIIKYKLRINLNKLTINLILISN